MSKNSKWIIIGLIILALGIVGTTIALNNDENEEKDEKDEEKTSQEGNGAWEEDEEESDSTDIVFETVSKKGIVGEPVALDNVEITVTEIVRNYTDEEYNQPSEGNEFIKIVFEFKNIGDKTIEHKLPEFWARHGRGKTHFDRMGFDMSKYHDTVPVYGEVKPDETIYMRGITKVEKDSPVSFIYQASDWEKQAIEIDEE